MFLKILRRSGFGPTALKLMAPFLKVPAALPSAAEAESALHAHSSDPGTSCIWDKRRGTSGIELDIIIPAYNMEKYIARCIDSALCQQTRHSFRLIVIDDGSKDNTSAIIDGYAGDERLLIVHQENRGFSGARNAGLALSDADYVMFLDADDTLPEAALEQLLSCAKGNKAAIVEGGFNSVDMQGKILSSTGHKAGAVDPRKELFGFTAMKIISAELMDGLCFPDGYWYEDSIMAQIIYPLAQSRGLSAWGLDHKVYNYSVNPGGISHTGRRSPKSLDSLYITMQLFRDREKLGLEKDQGYYEYILNMLSLSYKRAEQQSEDIKKAMFVIWKDFLDREFSGFESSMAKHKLLQQAVREGNYRLYSAACRLI